MFSHEKFGLDEDQPSLPPHKKFLKRFDSDSNVENHDFATAEETYHQNFFHIFNQVIKLLRERFDTDTAKFFKSLEAFAFGEEQNSKSIVEFYKNDFSEVLLVIKT